MTEAKRDFWDIILKIVIAVVVPITLAIVGIYGQAIIADYSASAQQLERIGRRAEAETSFRRQMFASLFTDFVDQISETDDPIKLDALTTRLELLTSNFSRFLNLQPLFHQLERKVMEVYDAGGGKNSSIIELRRAAYLHRLRSAARGVLNDQVQQIDRTGNRIDIVIPLKYFDGNQTEYVWPRDTFSDREGDSDIVNNQELTDEIKESMSLMQLDGVDYKIEIGAGFPDIEGRQVEIRLFIREGNNSKDQSLAFKLDSYTFPLVNNTALANNHRVAVTLQHLDHKFLRIAVHLFRNIERYSGAESNLYD